MTRATFPLFQSHIDLAHDYWKRIVRPGDLVIDATCGNGFDTLTLAQLALTEEMGTLYAFDWQETAIAQTELRLQKHLSSGILDRVTLLNQCHSEFPTAISQQTARLIVYNLGYLPGGDKKITTKVGTTLVSIQKALTLLEPEGCLSLTIYPGHSEGTSEENEIIPMLQGLDPKAWSCCYHRWVNRGAASPGLMLIQRGRGELSAM